MKTSKLNSSLNQQRSQNLGVEEYVWRTAGDERVRDSHKSENGKTFGWDDPPKDTGHPGQDIQCSDGTCLGDEIHPTIVRRWRGNGYSLETPDGYEIHPAIVRRWLTRNRNRILDYIGTVRDPEED